MAEELEKEKKSTRGRKKAEPKVEKLDDNNELEQVKKEKDELAKMLKKMQAQMESLQNQFNAQNSDNNNIVVTQSDNITRTVKVISLVPNTYNLTTQPNGRGKLYTFNKFGDSLNIRFTDMQDILNIYGQQFESGMAILTNKKDYDDLAIGYLWDSVISKDKLDRLLELKDEESINAILNMDKDTQERIARIIAQKIFDGVNYNYNVIRDLEDNGIEINSIVEMLKAGE